MEPSYIQGTSLQAAPPPTELKRHASAPTPARPAEAAEPSGDERPPPGLGAAPGPPKAGNASDFGTAMAMNPYAGWGSWPADLGTAGPPPPGLHAPPTQQPGWLTRATSAPAALTPCFGGGWGAPPTFGCHPAEAPWHPVGLDHHAGGFYDADPYRDTACVTRGVDLSSLPPDVPPAPTMPPPLELLTRASSAGGAALGAPPGLAPCEPGVGDPWPAGPPAGEAAAKEPPAEELGVDDALGDLGSDKPAQTLVRSRDDSTGVSRVSWVVDAAKLRTSDKVAVSPSFEVADEVGPFKLMISPKVVSDRKGGASFKKAKGRGYVQLKCEASEGALTRRCLTFSVSVGTGPKAQLEHGLVRHNFADCGVCCLPKEFDEWDFSKAVDEATQSFVVCLRVYPQASNS